MNKNELKVWRENYTPFTGMCLGEGLRLNVHFEEKEYVKDFGARWNPDPSGKGGYWWMPIEKLSHRLDSCTPSIVNIFEAGDSVTSDCSNGVTIFQWLNDNKMISGEFHGLLHATNCDTATLNLTPDIYALRMLRYSVLWHFAFFAELGIVKVAGNGQIAWYCTEDARKLWNEMVASTGGSTRERTSEVVNSK